MSENEEIINYIKRAFELKSQECYKQAIEMLYKALSIEPDNIEILYQTGELYFLLHNYPRAIQYPERILAQEPEHIPSLKLLRDICIRQNELIRAKELSEKLYKLEPNEKNLIKIIDLYGRLNLLEELTQYDTQIKNSDKCLYTLANSYYKNKNLVEAKKYIDLAIKINSENEDCEILSGKILFDENKLEESKAIFDKFGKHSSNPEVLNYQGLFAMEEMNFIDAIKDFSKAVNLNKSNPVYLFNLANAYFLNGWKEEAIQTYKKAICVAPDNLDYRYSLAYLYYKYQDYEKAQKEVDFILENDRKYYSAQVIKALLLYQNKNYLEAEEVLNQNIKAGVEEDFTLDSLAKIELELGKFNKAEEHMQSVITRAPYALEYQIELGNIYVKEKNYKKALEVAQKVISENTNYIDAYILGAKATYLNKDYDKSKEFAQNALSLDINCAAGYYYLALVRVEEKDYDEAIECMKRAITFDINNAKYYATMANIYKLNGDNKTAFDYVKEAESIDSSEEYKILYREYATLNRK